MRWRKNTILAGAVLLMVGVAPTVYGMVSAFRRIADGGTAEQVEPLVSSTVGFSMSPFFMTATVAGLLLVVVGLLMKSSPRATS